MLHLLTLTTAAPTDPTMGSGLTGTVIMLVAMFALLYFVMIRPENKRKKEAEQMRSNLKVGDDITTIGGIVGRVVNVKEDSLIIETGADRNKMTVKKWAVQSCETVHDDVIDDDDDDDDDDE